MPPPSAIVAEVSGAIAVIRFNRPATRNPLSIATLNELKETIATLTAREDLKAIIFTGTEDVFAAGADISELVQLNPERAFKFARFGQSLFQAIADANPVTIAAINGYCMGGALDLALACDLRIASPQAVFRHPGARLGIITGWGGTRRLPQLIGRARSLEFFLTARLITANEALSAGLVTLLDGRPLDAAIRIAELPVSKTKEPDPLRARL